METRIAVIFTCYNRKKETQRCIEALQNQKYLEPVKLDYYVCDDNSTDGTVDMIKQILHPENVDITISSGDLYWSKGMFEASKLAIKSHHDYYLMINDDVDFYDNCIQTMLTSVLQSKRRACIVGSTLSYDGKTISYGGRVFDNGKIGKNHLITPNGQIQPCQIANWNCFLIPDEIIAKAGLIDNHYQHGLGDFDYSLLLQRLGISIFVATNYIGRADRNSLQGTFQDHTLSRKDRMTKLFSVKGMPFLSLSRYYRKNYGLLGYTYLIQMYLKLIAGVLIQ